MKGLDQCRQPGNLNALRGNRRRPVGYGVSRARRIFQGPRIARSLKIPGARPGDLRIRKTRHPEPRTPPPLLHLLRTQEIGVDIRDKGIPHGGQDAVAQI